MSSDLQEKIQNKVKRQRQGLCGKCKKEKTTTRVTVMAQAYDYGQKTSNYKNLGSKGISLCDDCCLELFCEMVDLIEEL